MLVVTFWCVSFVVFIPVHETQTIQRLAHIENCRDSKSSHATKASWSALGEAGESALEPLQLSWSESNQLERLIDFFSCQWFSCKSIQMLDFPKSLPEVFDFDLGPQWGSPTDGGEKSMGQGIERVWKLLCHCKVKFWWTADLPGQAWLVSSVGSYDCSFHTVKMWLKRDLEIP